MLVAVSDLHWRDQEAHSTPPAMTEGFLKKSLVPQVRDAMRSVHAPGERVVEVVFLGDLVDINRSRYWVDGRSADTRTGALYTPWSHWRGLSQNANPGAPGALSPAAQFEQHVVAALGEILSANRANVAAWRAFKALDPDIWGDGEGKPERVRFHFLPGNHDRLANYSAVVRRSLIDELQLEGKPDEPFPWAAVFAEYAVAALHGHVIDATNFGGREIPADLVNAAEYGLPSLGDVITVTFGVGLRQRATLHPKLAPLAPSLELIDLVRPQQAAFDWLNRWGLAQQVHEELNQVVVSLVKEFLDDEFVKAQLPRFLSGIKRFLLRTFHIGQPRDIEGALKLFGKFSGGNSAEDYQQHMREAFLVGRAGRWVTTQGPMLSVVSGHTHRPLVTGLAGRIGEDPRTERIYVNTGCWLDVVEKGPHRDSGYVRRGQVIHAAFYRRAEDEKPGARRSYWEYWQGNLREGTA